MHKIKNPANSPYKAHQGKGAFKPLPAHGERVANVNKMQLPLLYQTGHFTISKIDKAFF